MTEHTCNLCEHYTYAKGYEDAKETTRRDTLLEVAKMVKNEFPFTLNFLVKKLERMAEECK